MHQILFTCCTEANNQASCINLSWWRLFVFCIWSAITGLTLGPMASAVQVKEAAAEAGVEVGGENALPCFSHLHIDAAGLDRIVYNTQGWGPPLQVLHRCLSCLDVSRGSR